MSTQPNTGEGTLTYRVDGTGMLNDLKLGSIGSNQTTRLYLSGTCPNEGDITRSRSAIATISSNAPSLNNSGSLGFNVYCFPPDPVPYFLEPFFWVLVEHVLNRVAQRWRSVQIPVSDPRTGATDLRWRERDPRTVCKTDPKDRCASIQNGRICELDVRWHTRAGGVANVPL